MFQTSLSILALLLLFDTTLAQDSNAASSSTLDPTITGIIAGVGVVVVLGLSFLLWRVPLCSVAAFVCIVSIYFIAGLSKRADP
jgi:hypothetical protein